MDCTDHDLTALLSRFGHTSFRPGQESIIRTLLRGRDVLAVLPTGGGKSLTYQIAAQVLPGITIVVSPLIALMKDQVESLEERGIDVGFVNCTQSETEIAEEIREVETAESKILYVTPERLRNPEFMAEIRNVPVSLVVVDEAHSVSQWGHSFRPSYLALGPTIESMGGPTVLALTATATPWVRNEICERLCLRDPQVLVRDTDRPNLFLDVCRIEDKSGERHALQKLLSDGGDQYGPETAQQIRNAMRGNGIIYTATTKAAEETAEWLAEWGIDADYYHGRRKKSDRERVQDEFMDGRLRVIAATNAFGMGVDKPDVRFVIHRNIPGNVEAYYQEAGRAGRDGRFARSTIIYRPGDLGRAAFLSATGTLSRDEVERVRRGLLLEPEGTLEDLEEAVKVSKGDVARLMTILEREQILEATAGQYRMLVPDFDSERVPLDEEEHRRMYEQSRLEMMRGYAELDACRREYILNYFGETYEELECAMCDQCLQKRPDPNAATDSDTRPRGFTLGAPVAHKTLGRGVVQRVEGHKLTVLFDTQGYRTLALDIVEEQGLLVPA